MSEVRQQIIQDIQAYMGLRRFSNDSTFKTNLNQLQQWQHQQMANRHQPLLKQPNSDQLIHFFLEEIYSGIDLSQVANRLEKAIKVADKLFTDMSLIAIAFKFNRVTAELDEALTTQLFKNSQIDSLNEKAYQAAIQALNDPDKRKLQLDLIRQFAQGLDDIVHDKSVYRAFKLGKYPAKLGGLGSLYQLMENGFEAMLSIENGEALINELVDQEEAYFENLY